MRLKGKTALVTGATSGIGEAISIAFAREGARVIVTGRDEKRGHAVVAGIIASGGTAKFVRADLTTKAGVDNLAGRADESFGQVDILVNNAGIFPFGSTLETPEAAFDSAYAVNVKAPFYLTGALATKMAGRGSGKVINITTMVAHFGMPGMALYSSTKAALTLLTKAWAAEFGPKGVNVNAIAPGPVRTPGTEAMGDGLDQLAKTLPAGRAAKPAEIAEAAVYLASEEAGFVHGAILPVDGGRVAV